MPEPTIEEILRVGFESAEKLNPLRACNWTVSWSDDPVEDAAIIRHLVDIAQGLALLPHEIRAWAFDALAARARELRERGRPGSFPYELTVWCTAVVSGACERPKRSRGRDRRTNMIRNRLIIDAVAWIERRGETKTRAIEIVAGVVEGVMKTRNPRLSFGPDAVETVLNNGDPVKDWKKEIDGFLSP